MKNRGMKRRDFLEVTGAGPGGRGGRGAGRRPAHPEVGVGGHAIGKGADQDRLRAVLSGTLAGYAESHKIGAGHGHRRDDAKGDRRAEGRDEFRK